MARRTKVVLGSLAGASWETAHPGRAALMWEWSRIEEAFDRMNEPEYGGGRELADCAQGRRPRIKEKELACVDVKKRARYRGADYEAPGGYGLSSFKEGGNEGLA